MLTWLLRLFNRRPAQEPNRNSRRAIAALYRHRIGSRRSAQAFAETAVEMRLTPAEIDAFAREVDGIDERAIVMAKRAVRRAG